MAHNKQFDISAEQLKEAAKTLGISLDKRLSDNDKRRLFAEARKILKENFAGEAKPL